MTVRTEFIQFMSLDLTPSSDVVCPKDGSGVLFNQPTREEKNLSDRRAVWTRGEKENSKTTHFERGNGLLIEWQSH